MDEADYATGRIPGRTYFSRPFPRGKGEPKDRKFGYKVFREDDRSEYAFVRNEVVLRVTRTGRQQVKILFQTTNRRIHEVIIQRFRAADGRPIGGSILTLQGDEIQQIVDFIRLIQSGRLGGDNRIRIEADEVDDFVLSDDAAARFVKENIDLVTQVVENDLTTKEIVSLGYRKQQLEKFRSFLYDGGAFEAEMKSTNVKKPELLWQQFFENNQWILGYGLNFVFSSGLSDRKLEQVTSGFSVAGPGKRVDALLRTHGFVSALCFVELKTHLTDLTRKADYRAGVWPVSNEVAGGIAQVQRTVRDAVEVIRRRLETLGADGAPSGEVSYLYKPRSVLIAGNLREFQAEGGLNEARYGCFETFRRSLTDPEILTFDELYERARFIVEDV